MIVDSNKSMEKFLQSSTPTSEIFNVVTLTNYCFRKYIKLIKLLENTTTVA